MSSVTITVSDDPNDLVVYDIVGFDGNTINKFPDHCTEAEKIAALMIQTMYRCLWPNGAPHE